MGLAEAEMFELGVSLTSPLALSHIPHPQDISQDPVTHFTGSTVLYLVMMNVVHVCPRTIRQNKPFLSQKTEKKKVTKDVASNLSTVHFTSRVNG